MEQVTKPFKPVFLKVGGIQMDQSEIWKTCKIASSQLLEQKPTITMK